jgi:6,7-dimethyl-8-ribityllumazine synthase
MVKVVESKPDAHGLRIGIIVSRFNQFITEKLLDGDALICLGAVIRGDTPHFEYVSDAVTNGILAAMRQYQMPIGFGVLTTNDSQQAMERAGTKDANKGYEAALTAVEMANVLRKLSPR